MDGSDGQVAMPPHSAGAAWLAAPGNLAELAALQSQLAGALLQSAVRQFELFNAFMLTVPLAWFATTNPASSASADGLPSPVWEPVVIEGAPADHAHLDILPARRKNRATKLRLIAPA